MEVTNNLKTIAKYSVGVGLALFIFWLGLHIASNNPNVVEGDICSEIRGTPAWVQDNIVLGYGIGFAERYTKKTYDNVVEDYLIPHEIEFIWWDGCPYCHEQINSFGEESWKKYQESGLTTHCNFG